jgi:hypothetical protein
VRRPRQWPPPLSRRDGRSQRRSLPRAVLEPPAGTGLGGEDVVMVPADDDSAPPLPAGGRDVVTSTVLEPSPAVGATLVEDVTNLATC